MEKSNVVESSKTVNVPNVTVNRRNEVQKKKRAHVNIKKSCKNNYKRVESPGKIKGTITSMFDIMKRKLSPEKEAVWTVSKVRKSAYTFTKSSCTFTNSACTLGLLKQWHGIRPTP